MSIQPIAGDNGKPVAATGATPTKPVPQSTSENQKAPPSKTTTKTADSVQISNVGKAAFQEATETAAQTAQEARNGDRQAQRLLAKEEASKAAETPTESTLSPGKLLQ